MASVFVLGPSHWLDNQVEGLTPWDVRRRIVSILSKRHDAYLMEDTIEDLSDRDLTDKFFLILKENQTSHVVVYWPRDAKMQTTLDEIIHLRHGYDRGLRLELRLLCEEGIVKILQGTYSIAKGAVSRSRYLDALNTLQIKLLTWSDHHELLHLVNVLSEEMP